MFAITLNEKIFYFKNCKNLFTMNKTSTAVYLLIAILALMAVVFAVAKPVLVDKAGNKTATVNFLNFKKLA